MKNFEELIRRLREWRAGRAEIDAPLVALGATPDPRIETLDRAIEALERMRWIPVSERIPTFDLRTDVMVYGNDDGTRYWQAGVCGLHDEAWLKKYRVTHWMPLPEPPSALDHEQPARTDIGMGDAKV